MLMAEEQVLRLITQVFVLLVVARTLGYAARRLGQPAVLGELLAGVLLGPSVLGAVATGGLADLIPRGRPEDSPLLALAWLGALFVVVVAGYEVDVPLVRRLLRRSAGVPVGAFLLPMAVGMGVGALLPVEFVTSTTDRALFAGFLGLTVALSSLPVVSRILRDLDLLRRDIGQVTMVAAMADDVVGLLVLGVLTTLALGGGATLAGAGLAALGLVAFVLLTFTVGQTVVDRALRLSFELTEGVTGAFTVAVATALAGAGLAQLFGLDPLLGGFLMGVVLRRSPMRRGEVAHGIELVTTGVLAPIFFATAGMSLDVATLTSTAVVGWTVLLLVVAVVTKVAGAYLGGRMSRLDATSATAIGAGLTARGALGVVVASVALELGVFTETAFTAVVAVALLSSALAPWLMTLAMRRSPLSETEADRLRREALLGESRLVNARRILLPTRGGTHSRLAARIVDLSVDRDASVTVLSVHDGDRAEAETTVEEVGELFGLRRVDRLVRRATEPAQVVGDEARYGYDLLVLGASQDVHTPAQLSEQLGQLLVATRLPVVLVRAGQPHDEGLIFRRIITTATGSRHGRAAEEVAFVLATRTGAEVDVVHVISRSDRILHAAWSGRPDQHSTARTLLSRSVALAGRFGSIATGLTRVGSSTHEQLLEAADERRADTIVVGTEIASIEGRPFLGHGIEYLLEKAPQTLIIVAYPS